MLFCNIVSVHFLKFKHGSRTSKRLHITIPQTPFTSTNGSLQKQARPATQINKLELHVSSGKHGSFNPPRGTVKCIAFHY